MERIGMDRKFLPLIHTEDTDQNKLPKSPELPKLEIENQRRTA
jgi:hypothetical protein